MLGLFNGLSFKFSLFNHDSESYFELGVTMSIFITLDSSLPNSQNFLVNIGRVTVSVISDKDPFRTGTKSNWTEITYPSNPVAGHQDLDKLRYQLMELE